jgi:hypothetical protein
MNGIADRILLFGLIEVVRMVQEKRIVGVISDKVVVSGDFCCGGV